MANTVRQRFLDILRAIKPEFLEDETKIPKDVTWAKVRLQKDTHSCGLHVISWLQQWDGSEHEANGCIMPHYTDEDLRELKVGFLWWLVNHPRNNHCQKVKALMEDYHKRLKIH
ncbi:hypothetical protein QN277_022582 [Acacia crassicarpa]|uniref:Ubiquitin-like protease family profile domain-containing protein n=1 Tax=Acacia crassicarpa TaxID=499986 RepID=A0AAE1ML49_9FABA|nr:hypothetical protein QN277_022582 [Acacia crassicarpa]